MTDTLLPCPFCGGEADAYQSGAWLRDHFMWYVKCGRCFTATCDKSTEAEAVAAWNTRTERTCRKVIPDEMEGYVFCSECGAEIGEYGYPNYCHNCGAKVVER